MKNISISTATGCLAAWMMLANLEAFASSVCASVQLRVIQPVTTERQGFDATLGINNPFEQFSISDVNVHVYFLDDQGNEVLSSSNPGNTNALFFVREDRFVGITSASGGSVEPLGNAEIHWLIVPAQGAGGTNVLGRSYQVGATLTYTMLERTEEIEVTPDTIHVRPMPKMTIDYFLPHMVYGDDPFTEPIEESVPFILGTRVLNSGAGTAHRLKIESAQPQIETNELGLLVGFQLHYAQLQDAPCADSLLVDFGTVPPGTAKVAQWGMSATLEGRMTNLNVNITHASELGGELTTLIEAARPHTLVKDVLVDLPDRDQIRDFLAADSGSLTVYESDALDTPVQDVSSVAGFVNAGDTNGVPVWQFDVPVSNQIFYARISFPDAVLYEVVSAVRADGKVLNPANVWLSKSRDKTTDPWDHWFHLFDANGGGEYRVTFRDRPVPENRPPVLAYVGPRVTREGEQLAFLVEASDPDGTFPVLTLQPLPAGATFTTNGDGTATFEWTPNTGQYGVYPVRIIAGDGEYIDWEIVKIYVGTPGEEFCNGVPCSLEDWTVEIRELWSWTSSGNATVVWDSAEGLLYDLYQAEYPFGVGAVWNPLRDARPGTGEQLAEIDTTANNQVARRYYRLVLAGETPDTNKVWGVIRRDIRPAGYTLISPPVRTDRRFDGEMGYALSDMLQGNDGGIGAGGDEVYVLQSDGSWRILYLDESLTWREADGSESTYELPAGQGLWVARKSGTSARLSFTGPVGNDGTQSVALQPGFNLIGVSEGKDLPLKETFATANPQGGSVEETADQLVFQNPDGSWRRMMFVTNWGAPYDGNWFDLNTFQIVPTNEVLEPGEAYFYLRQGEATDVQF